MFRWLRFPFFDLLMRQIVTFHDASRHAARGPTGAMRWSQLRHGVEIIAAKVTPGNTT
jgi:hypothetical protein